MLNLQTNAPIVFSPRRIALLLGFIAVALSIQSQIASIIKHTVVMQPDFTQQRVALGIIERFDVNSEIAISTWFSSCLLLICAVLLYVIVLQEKQAGGHNWKRWALLSGLFLLMALDESASLHEMVGNYLHEQFKTDGFLRFAWIVPGAVLVVAMFALYWRFFALLPDRLWIWFLLGAVAYFSGAVAMEAVGGYYASQSDTSGLVYDMMTNVEELMEMLGAVIFVYAILSYIRSHVRLSLSLK